MRFSTFTFAALAAILTVAAPSSGRADMPPWNDIPDILRDLLCATDPGLPQCLNLCPPYCLSQPERGFAALQGAILPKVRRSGLVVEPRERGFRIANRAGVVTTLACRKAPLPASLRGRTTADAVQNCVGVVDGERHAFTLTDPLDKARSKRAAVRARKFFVAANRVYADELAVLDTGSRTADGAPLEDYIFCAVATAAGTAGGGVGGGIIVGSLCSWFISNGID